MSEELSRISLVDRKLEMEMRTRENELARITQSLRESEQKVASQRESYENVLKRVRNEASASHNPKVAIHNSRLLTELLRGEKKNLKVGKGLVDNRRSEHTAKLHEVLVARKRKSAIQNTKSIVLRRELQRRREGESEDLMQAVASRANRNSLREGGEKVKSEFRLGEHKEVKDRYVERFESVPTSYPLERALLQDQVESPSQLRFPEIFVQSAESPFVTEENAKHSYVLPEEFQSDEHVGFVNKLAVWKCANTEGLSLSYETGGRTYQVELLKDQRALTVQISPGATTDSIALRGLREEILQVLKSQGYVVRKFIIAGKLYE